MRLVLFAIGLGWLVAACSPVAPPASAPIKLRIGTATTPPPALPESTLWLARDLGFYQKEGLDVDIVEAQATPSVIAAMRAGDVDVGNINSEDVIRLTANKDLEMRTINSTNGRNFFMIVGKNSVGSVTELAGRSFAIARVGSQDHSLSAKVLAARGLAADAVSYVAIGQPNVRAQAPVAGQIDATTMSLATWITVRNEPGIKVLVSADDYFAAVPLVNKGNAVTGSEDRRAARFQDVPQPPGGQARCRYRRAARRLTGGHGGRIRLPRRSLWVRQDHLAATHARLAAARPWRGADRRPTAR